MIVQRSTLSLEFGNAHIMIWILKGPVKAVSGHKIAPNRFKTTYRSILTFEEKKQSDRNSLLLTCLKLFQALTRL